MAHDLAHNNRTGGASFYSLREAGWHGLGNVVAVPASDEKALELAGLDWIAQESGLYTSGMDLVTSHKAITRSDTGEILSIVGRGYVPLQNAALFELLRDCDATASLEIETAGALGMGETVWAMARVPGLDLAMGKDLSWGYLLVTNGHDGKTPVRIFPTSVRVVCRNTMRMARDGRGAGRGTLSNGWDVKHTGAMVENLASVARAYSGAIAAHAATVERAKALASVRSSRTSLETITRAALAVEVGPSESDRSKAIREAREKAIAVIRASATCDMEGTAGTLWSDLQAVTEWVDHERISDAAERFKSAQFGGEGEDMKARAYDAALALV
jgi:phage/plasmid-like protein (TIGR03299 family)